MKDDIFKYSYSATKNEEVEKIRSKYIKKEHDKTQMLRALDAKVERPGLIASILVGLFGAVLFGYGIFRLFHSMETFSIITILLLFFGLIFIALALPIFNMITKTQRSKYADQILSLCDELEGKQK